jgi:hypothetical protein
MDLQDTVHEGIFLKSKVLDFAEDIRNLSKEYIGNFFKHEEMHLGGKIPNEIMYSSNYVDLVIDADISSGISSIYRALEKYELDEEEQIKLVLGILNKCASRGVPKFFAAGITIMYMEICKGVGISELVECNEF